MRFIVSIFLCVNAFCNLNAQNTTDEAQQKCKVRVGSLLFEAVRIDVGEAIIGQVKADTLLCYNPTDSTFRISIGDTPEGLLARFDKEEINAKDSARLLISLYQDDPTKVGYYFETFSLIQNQEYILYPYFSYTAKLVESFAHLSSDELDASPKIECLTPTFDFGIKNEGARIKCNFELKNTGKIDLEIYRISTSCGCTEATSELMLIPPGGTTTISATFDSTSRYGKQIKTINIYNNSPLSPEFKLTITGTIE